MYLEFGDDPNHYLDSGIFFITIIAIIEGVKGQTCTCIMGQEGALWVLCA